MFFWQLASYHCRNSVSTVGLEDGLLLKQTNDLWVVALLMLRAQALRLAPRLLKRHQRIAAKVKLSGLALVAVANLKGDLALGRDAHTQAFAVAPLLERCALLPVVGLEPCVQNAIRTPGVYIARERGVRGGFIRAAMYTNSPSRPVSP